MQYKQVLKFLLRWELYYGNQLQEALEDAYR